MGGDGQKIRTYLDEVPEDVKEELSKAWGKRKKDTYAAAEEHGIKIEEGESFNKVVVMELEPGFYHLASGIVSTKDISPEKGNIGDLCSSLINDMFKKAESLGCVPIACSNVCDWDSKYAKDIGANVFLRKAVIDECIENKLILTGGETANLGDQVRQKGMSWMFTLLSRYNGSSKPESDFEYSERMDHILQGTFKSIADKSSFEIVKINGAPMIHIKEKGKFIMTADGTGSKSIVCYQVDHRTDDEDTIAMGADDATRDGAFPIAASIGMHSEDQRGVDEQIANMKRSGDKHMLPLVGSVHHVSPDVNTYTMNGVIFSQVREESAQVGKIITPGLGLVVLYEEQRSNGITLQRRIFEDAFGKEWYKVKTLDAFRKLNDKLGGKYSGLPLEKEERTLGELVAKASTPYFRTDSMMPKDIMDTVRCRINVSSGGLIGKTRRLLQPFDVGANYFNLFEAPSLVLLLQMASQTGGGVVPDEVAYYTWGCGQGAVIGTTDPDTVKGYYQANGINAKVAGVTTDYQEVCVTSRCLDSTQQKDPLVLRHKYTDKPLG